MLRLVALLALGALVNCGGGDEDPARDARQVPAQSATVDPLTSQGLTPGPVARTPAPAPFSGSRALDVSPAPGLRLTAPAGALDRDREFRVAPLEGEALAAVCAQAARSNELVLGGFELDAGMEATDVFPGELALTLDLGHFEVPEEVRDSLLIAVVDAQGYLRPLQTELRGGMLTAKVRHNNKFVVMCTLWAVMYGIMAYQDAPDMPKGDFTGVYWVPGDCRFRLLYPKSWPPRDPDRAAQYRRELYQVAEKHGMDQPSFRRLMEPPASSSWNPFAGLGKYKEAWTRWRNMKNDATYKALIAYMSDKSWLRAVWLPVCVGHAATALERGYEYLVGERGFRPPGIATFSYCIDAYVLRGYLGSTSYGECRNLWTHRPFLILNADKIPDVDEAAFVGPMAKVHRADLDALQTTAMHELFHACQSAYSLFEVPSYLWFTEATAVAVETEAGPYYDRMGYVTTWDETGRTVQAFTRRLDYTDPASNSVTQNHGYSAAYLVEALRDRYYATDPLTFLPKLMEDFSAVRGGTVASLYRTTSGRRTTFEKDYWLSCLELRDDIAALAPNITIGVATPYYCWKLKESQPLSGPAVRLTFQCGSLPADAIDGALLVANDSTGEQLPTAVDWRPLGGAWSVLPRAEYAASPLPATPGDFAVTLQRIEPYVEAQPRDPTAELGSTDVFLMLRPPAPPQVEVKDGHLVIRILDSPLMKAPPSPLRGPYVKMYEVTIASKTDPKVKLSNTYYTDQRVGGVLTSERPLSQIVAGLGVQSMADTPLVVTYREVASPPQKIMGPPSPPAEIDAGGAVLMPVALVHMEVPFEYRVGGTNQASGKTFSAQYEFEHEFTDASWTGTTLATRFEAADGLDDSVTITVDRNADKIAKLTIGRVNRRHKPEANETGRVEFTWRDIPRRHTVDLGPQGPAFFLFFVSGKELQELSVAAVNEASGTAQEYNPDTGKAETVTFSSKLTSVNWGGSFVFVVLGTMTDEQIQDLITRGVVTQADLEKRFARPMQEFMGKIRNEIEACKAARQTPR